jgi:predicted amidophosphoribosyltransferase
MHELGLLLRPAACLACGRVGAWPCCASCLPPAAGPAVPAPLLADPSIVLWTLGPYRDALRTALLAGKLRGQAAALAELGSRLSARLDHAGIGADLVTWVTSGPGRLGPRDHARVLALAVARGLGLPAVALLAPAPGRDLGRARALTGESPWGGPPRPPPRPPPRTLRGLTGGRVLVVDDVATTGETLAGAAAALLDAGARAVEAATLAAAPGATLPPDG